MENFIRGDQQEWGTKKDVSLPMVIVLSSRDKDDHLPNVRIYVKEMTDAEKSMLKSQV